MATVSREDVVARWPTLSKVDDEATWNAALQDAQSLVPDRVWGTLAFLGTIQLAAHFIVYGNPALRAGNAPVSSEHVGDVGRTYAVLPMPFTSNALTMTLQGREYLRLRSMLGITMTVV